MDYGWDTSDEEGGMAIDLDAKQDEHRDGHMNTQDGKDGEANNQNNIDSYDPSEPTDDYDPAEPTNDAEGEASSPQKDGLNLQRGEESPEYDPAEPTLSDEERGGTPMSKTEDSQTEAVSESDGRWDSQMYSTQNEPVSPEYDGENGDNDDVSFQNDRYVEKGEEDENFTEKVSNKESPLRMNKSKSESPSVGNLDTDENTQNSIMDDVNSDVPEVTFDESDFVLEKEPFAPAGEQRDSIGSPWSTKDQTEDVPSLAGEPTRGVQSPNMNSTRSDVEEKEERERFRRQEEVDSRNEEALVDLFREESEPDRIEEDLEQPIKKNKKKIGSKKVKKKGKKLKKGMGKKGQKKHDGEGEVEDERFVEIRRERNSVESREEGELEGEGMNFVHRKSYDDRLPMDVYEETFSLVSSRQEEEQREPGEIVEEGKKKSSKKREKKEKKKKKSKREVATIEEGNQGDDDSQKFPSFLAGFFVQDEGEEDVDENIGLSRSFDEEPTFQKTGVKNYRKRHSSGAEDSVKSFEDIHRGETQEVRGEEPEHRKTRKHDDKRQEGREVRQRETRDTREVRHEKEHRHGTPRDKDRDRERERTRADRDRERGRDKDRENREREREREREVVRERERSRRVEVDERRRRHTRSASRERRRRSASAERVRRSRSRDRTARHRRQRSKSRERSVERERERERPKRKHRDRSKEREVDRRVRRPTHSRSRSPHRRLERASSNKENREDSTRRRRRHARAVEDSDTDNRESSRRSQRRQRRERERSSSSSSSSGSSSERNMRGRTSSHYRSFHSHHSSDEGASSDVILVEPERIVINLDEEEDPPSRVDITHHNIEDDSTKLVDGESIPPPPELSRNARGSALIQINPAEPENEMSEEGDATPTRDEHTDDAPPGHAIRKSVPESDYDPAHPTEETEEHDNSLPTAPVPTVATSITLPAPAPVPVFVPAESGPVPPNHPPPEEVRPSPPPGPSLVETQTQLPQFSGAPLPQLTLINAQFQQQPPPPTHQQPSPHQPGLLPFPGVPHGQAQRFPPWPHVNGPNASLMHSNAGPLPGFANQRGLLPTPDTRPLFPLDSSRPPPPFGSALLSQPPPPREAMPLMRPQMPISAMAPLEQLTSLLPALDRAKMAQRREDQQSMVQQMFKHPLPVTGLMGKAPLMSNSASNMSSGAMRMSRGGRSGGDFAESTEVVDMDMSPGEDDCELELPSPNSSDSDRDDRRRRGRKSDSRTNRTANDISKTATGLEKGIIQPSVYLKALSKVIEKLAPKSQPQTSESGGAAMQHHDKSKAHSRKRVEMNDDDVPASAVELTNKEKYLKKLHLQERVIDEVKLAIKPFYSSKKITKEQYKLILRKAVPKVCHSKSGNINPQKIQQLVEAYVGKLSKGGAPSSKKKKTHAAKDPSSGPKEGGVAASAAIRQNGDRAKKPTR